jgi:hypothetical protein
MHCFQKSFAAAFANPALRLVRPKILRGHLPSFGIVVDTAWLFSRRKLNA